MTVIDERLQEEIRAMKRMSGRANLKATLRLAAQFAAAAVAGLASLAVTRSELWAVATAIAAVFMVTKAQARSR